MKTIRFGKMTIFIKMLILLFVSVSVPVTVLGYLYYTKSGGQIEQITSALLKENLQQNRQRVEQFFRRAELHSESIIGSQKLELLENKDEHTPLGDELFLSRSNSLVNELRGSYELSIYPPDVSRFEAYAALLQLRPADRNPDWLLEALRLQGKGYWYFENDSFIFVRLIRALSDLRPLAVIKLSIPSAEVQQLFISPSGYPNFQHYIVDSGNDNTLLASDGSALKKNKDLFVSSLPLTFSSWKLVAAVPERDLLGPVETIKQFSFLLVAISIAVISLLLVLIVGSFITPIQYLVGQMRKAQLGNLVPSEKYEGRSDEIGQLARGYNSLIFGMQELLAATKQMESEKSRMEMQMLIHQINPHFLYNTLDAIKWRAEHVQEKTITEMVTSLGNLIRYSINNGEEFTTVEREIEQVKSYVRIESLRHRDAFQVLFNVQPRVLNAPILKLIVQPLVENSIRHGVGKLPHGKGKILVRIFADGDDLVCTVEDNGPGCPEEVNASLDRISIPPGQTGGVGLFNVNRRLKTRFGSNYGVMLAGREHGGCRATIRHPVLESGET